MKKIVKIEISFILNLETKYTYNKQIEDDKRYKNKSIIKKLFKCITVREYRTTFLKLFFPANFVIT